MSAQGVLMYSMNIGGVELSLLPPAAGVTVSGGGRPVNERPTIEGRIVATRNPLSGSKKITVTTTDNYAISAADAAAIAALGDGPFTFSLTGYDGAGSYGGCVFEEPPSFPPVAGHPAYRRCNFTVYILQGGGA